MKPYFIKLISVFILSTLMLTSCGSGKKSSENSYISESQDNSESQSDYSEDVPDFSFSPDDKPNSETNTNQSGNTSTPPDYLVSYKDNDLSSEYDEASAVSIICDSTNVSINGEGASAENGIVTISKSGTFLLSGNLTGRVIVNSADTEPTRLVFAGINITCTTSAPVYVASADKVIVILKSGTENFVKDGNNYTYDDITNQEPSAAIFSKDDLTFNGEGSLTVDASFNNGIQCKDKLKICGGKITVNSKNDGVKGKDCVGICGGKLLINAKADGIQSTNTDSTDVGFVNISGGSVKINSTLDGIQGENGVCISGGTVSINAGSGSSSTTDSKKGIKGAKDVTIIGGTIQVTSTDDAIHSDGNINIDGGSSTVSSNDDAFHAESKINIKNGYIKIERSKEGLEAAKITVDGGEVIINASDDGVNASDGTGGKGGMGGGMSANSNCLFTVNGGFVYVNASGDGLDSNGSISITGGTVLCEGPTNGGNSSVDHNGGISITGGTLLSFGSSGMAGEILSNTTGTTQCVFGSYCNGNAGTAVAIKNSAGKVLIVFKTTKQFGHLVFSSSELKNGETYEIWVGGEGSGQCKNGVYSENKYEGGSKLASVTQSATVTGGGGGMGGPGGEMNPGGVRPPFENGTRPQKPGRM